MNGSLLVAQAWRALFLLLLQTLILQHIPLGKVSIYIYPLFIMLLPLETPKGLLIFIGFIYGIFVDLFYNTLGLHAFVLTAIAYCKPWICVLVEPRGGYEVGQMLTKANFGISWFLKYSAVVMGAHIIVVTTLEELSFSLLWFFRIILSYIISMLVLMIYQYIFNPK